MEVLKKTLKEKIDELKYSDLIRKRASGMTRLQEWFRQNGIKEVLEDETWDENLYIRIKHPAGWTLSSWHDDALGGVKTLDFMILVPKELALKIDTLGFLP